MLAILLVAALPAAPSPEAKPPKGLPPAIRQVRLSGKGELSIQVEAIVQVYRAEKRLVNRNVNGKVVPVEVVVTTVTPERVVRIECFRAKGLTAQDVSGAKVDPKTLRKRLAKWTPVLVSMDGKPIDKGYLRLFSKGTLMLTLPASAAPLPPPAQDKRKKE
jgi:hypothetical protein